MLSKCLLSLLFLSLLALCVEGRAKVRFFDDNGVEIPDEDEEKEGEIDVFKDMDTLQAATWKKDMTPLTEEEVEEVEDDLGFWNEESMYSLKDPSEVPENADLSFLDAAHRQIAFRQRLRQSVEFYWTSLEKQSHQSIEARREEEPAEDESEGSEGESEGGHNEGGKEDELPPLVFDNEATLLDKTTVDDMMRSAAFDAVRRGDVKTLHVMLEKYNVSANLTQPSKEEGGEGAGLLHTAALFGQYYTVRYLLEQRSLPVDQKDDLNGTPLHRAVYNGHAAIAQLLIDNGADAAALTEDGASVLHLTVAGGYPDTLTVVLSALNSTDLRTHLQHQDNSGRSCLHLAAQRDFAGLAEMLRHHGAQEVLDNQGALPVNYTKVDVVKKALQKRLPAYEKSVMRAREQIPLHRDMKMKRFREVVRLIEEGANVTAADGNGETILHQAIRLDSPLVRGALFAVKQISQLVNVPNKMGDTPFHIACISGSQNASAIVDELLMLGANTSIPNANGETPLEFSRIAAVRDKLVVHTNAEEEEKKLQEHVDSTISSILSLPAEAKRVRELVFSTPQQLKSSVKAEKINPDSKLEFGGTALHLAIRAGKADIADALVEVGADVNAADKFGITALHFAAFHEAVDMVEKLAKAGADVNAADQDGNTPLHFAALKANRSVAIALIRAGAEVQLKSKTGDRPCDLVRDVSLRTLLGWSKEDENALNAVASIDDDTIGTLTAAPSVMARDEAGSSLLHYAAASGPDGCEVVDYLLEGGANPNTKDRHALTPLHLVSRDDSVCGAELLIKAGANVTAKDRMDEIPLHAAARSGAHRVVSALLAAGSPVNAPNMNGTTPLHYAAAVGDEKVVEELMKGGADVDAEDKFGSTPLVHAVTGDHAGTVLLLRKHGAKVDGHKKLQVPVKRLAQSEVVDRVLNAKQDKLDEFELEQVHQQQCGPAVSKAEEWKEVVGVKPPADSMRGGKGALRYKVKNVKDMPIHHIIRSMFIAVEERNPVVLQDMLEGTKGRYVNEVDESGQTLLLIATAGNDKDMVEVLLNSQADPNVASAVDGSTPLMNAAIDNNVEIARMLIKAGADVEAVENRGLTSLHFASAAGSTDVIELLLDNGARLEKRTKGGEEQFRLTPLMFAVRGNQVRAIKLLLDRGADIFAEPEEGVTMYELSPPGKVRALIAKAAEDALKKMEGEEEEEEEGVFQLPQQ
mmetsp:Transcript_21228/g.55211  ORF Transcript_21228/g.55211 Transcript_21228/m.55211 type:complete len:1203 (-) Transcript_21228:303-3911(-)